MRTFFVIVLSTLFCLLPGIGQPVQTGDSVTVQGTVSDAFSREKLVGVDVRVTDGKGFEASTTSTLLKGRQRRFDLYFFNVKVPRPGKYALTLSKDGYATKTLKITVPAKKYMKKVTFWKTDEILLSREREQTLGEATVTASRIMMVERGDTIIYNASAFQLAEGSMLDALIAQLPGVKLEAGGRITINGEFVQSLLVNGKNFFKGDPKIALDNLPAYMVNQVKAYRKEPEDAYLMGERNEELRKQDPWVIDVNLKRQYRQGWAANAEAAYGTDNRYLGRLFGMRFTDHSRLALYGSGNNVNNTANPANDGSWTDDQNFSGDLRTAQGGMMFGVDGKKTKIRFDTSVKGDYTRNHNLSQTASANFLNDRSTYGRSFADDLTKTANLRWDGELYVPLKGVSIRFSPQLSYNRTKANGLWLSGQWNENPAESYRGEALDSLFGDNLSSGKLIYANRNLSNSDAERLNANGSLRMRFRSPLFGKPTSVYLQGNIEKNTYKGYSQYLLNTIATGTSDYRNRFTDSPEKNYYWLARLEYQMFRNRHFMAEFHYEYKQSYQSNSRRPYRLDWLENGWDLPSGKVAYPIGLLPSAGDSLHRASDWDNSYRSLLMTGTHSPEFFVNIFLKKGGTINFSLPLRIMQRSIRDYRYEDLGKRTAFSRNSVAFEPSLMYLSPQKFTVRYSRSFLPASLSSMIEVSDNLDPLYIRTGNSHLKDTWQDNFSLSYNRSNTKSRQMISADGRVWLQTNSIGLARTYDSETGVTMVRPENMNGNWGADGSFSYEQAVGKNKRWQLGSETNVDYINSVDFLSDSPSVGEIFSKSTVRNAKLSETLKADYRKGSLHLGLRLSLAWRNATSTRLDFENINAADIMSGIVLNAPLVLGINASTDFSLYSHRGYQLSSMNSDDFIWNASLSRAFLRSKALIVKITAYDILAERSSLQYAIDAQGRTETWTNSLRRYAMVHLIYRFSKKPKNR